MPIPSLDSYVARRVRESLKIMLSECYIIEEALSDMDVEAKSNFMKTYCGDNPKKEIEVIYEFPQAKTSVDATYVIQLGGGSEDTKSIGGIEGTYEYKEDSLRKETVVATREGTELFLETKELIGSIEGIPNLSFSESDNKRIEGKRLYFSYEGNADIEGVSFDIIYTSKVDLESDPVGLKKGFTSRDNITVVGLSTNMDTARCLDAILKVILIIMRENLEEKSYYSLQTTQFSDMSPVIMGEEKPVFGRPVTMSYTISYTVDFNLVNQINKIIVQERNK
ncbi:hypothetical protein [Listeria phage P100plus]|uniref:Uncharacterized protein n=11 Tax=Pecentumvirus TaxID=1857844 RepID=S4U672_9CAUD|nr:hypothetical protein QLX35_gp159 [Listeria phage LP-125]YP_009044561.1 hypothetical protein LP083-2_105 [Listeria phage LP-083-2]YP_009592638.1 hypothetical protein FDG78_gp158 [Listeria phage LP-064]YP_009784538.1 hypothetical protein QLX40_gp026 [Listeria phage LP-124]YP_009793596.1 hypothetical protein QLX41_gp097 [Listeria phage LMTA-94]YP_406398.1 gp22 [Listeria phage P100]QDK04937.2 hypothetical protein FK486_0090 [Listeria phage LP-066]QJB22278.1 hypothetical protein [Listeria phag